MLHHISVEFILHIIDNRTIQILKKPFQHLGMIYFRIICSIYHIPGTENVTNKILSLPIGIILICFRPFQKCFVSQFKQFLILSLSSKISCGLSHKTCHIAPQTSAIIIINKTSSAVSCKNMVNFISIFFKFHNASIMSRLFKAIIT